MPSGISTVVRIQYGIKYYVNYDDYIGIFSDVKNVYFADAQYLDDTEKLLKKEIGFSIALVKEPFNAAPPKEAGERKEEQEEK